MPQLSEYLVTLEKTFQALRAAVCLLTEEKESDGQPGL